MRTTFKFPDEDDGRRNDAITRALKDIGRTPSFAKLTGLTGQNWYKTVVPSSVLTDFVNRTYGQFDNHQWFENVLPPAARVSFMTDLYKQLDTQGSFDNLLPQIDSQRWLEGVLPKVYSSPLTDMVASNFGQQEWLQGIYPRFDWSGYMQSITRDSSWARMSLGIAQTGVALADTVMTEDFIESLVEETWEHTDLDSNPVETDRADLAEFHDPVLDFILSRMAGWIENQYPELEDRAIRILNRAAASTVFVAVTNLLPLALITVLGPTNAVFPIALILGAVHFFSVQERDRLSPAHARALDFECPYCKAVPNAQCVTLCGDNIGQPTRTHADRLKLV